MEVCGGQTHSIIRNGIDQLLPDEIELIHGPGCPVCVTPLEMIDRALAIAARPGGHLLLLRRHAARAGLAAAICSRSRRRAATSGSSTRRSTPLSSLPRTPTARSCSSASASRRPRPRTRWPSIRRATRGLANFSMLVSHVLVPPAIEAIMSSPRLPRQRVPRRRPRVHVMGSLAVRAARRALPRADRGHRLRAARRARGDPPLRRSSSRPAVPRSRTRTSAPCAPRATCRPARCSRRCSTSATASGAASA